MTRTVAISKVMWAVALATVLALGGLGVVAPSFAVAADGTALAGGTIASFAPQAAKASKVKVASAKSKAAGKVTAKAAKVKGAKGYQFKIALNKKLTKGAKSKSTAKRSVTFKGLKKGMRYYVKVRAYTKVGGVKYWSAWSAAKAVRVKGKAESSAAKGSTNASAGYSTAKSPIAGTWTLSKISGAQNMFTINPSALKAVGTSIVATFSKNGKGTIKTQSANPVNPLNVNGTFTWTAVGDTTGTLTMKSFTMKAAGTSTTRNPTAVIPASLLVKGGKLLVINGGTTYTLAKS